MYVATGERPTHLAQRLDTRELLPDGTVVGVPKLTQLGHVKVRVKNFCSTCGGVHDPEGVIAYPAEVNECPGARHARKAGHSKHIPTKYTPAPAHNTANPSQSQPNLTQPTSATAHNTTNPSQSQLNPTQPTPAPTHNTTNPSQPQPNPTQPNPAPAHNTTNPSRHNTTIPPHPQPATAGNHLSQDRAHPHTKGKSYRARMKRKQEMEAAGETKEPREVKAAYARNVITQVTQTPTSQQPPSPPSMKPSRPQAT